ncbi:unnamed protein product, partial [Phaeothamnion confervicola]
ALSFVVLPDASTPYVVGALLASVGWWFYVTMLEVGGMSSRRTGVIGEEWTTTELRKLRRAGWLHANHVMLEGKDVDHVLFGPGGFFAIETKFRSDWTYAEKDLSAIAQQAFLAARDVRTKPGRLTRRFEPIVVTWGPNVRDVFPEVFERHGVTFCPGPQLILHLRSLPNVIDGEEVRASFNGLAEYVAKRDGGELRDDGPNPRSINQGLCDAFVVLGVALASLLLATSLSSTRPQGLWSVLATLALATGGLVLRRRHPKVALVRYAGLAMALMNLGLAALTVAALVYDRATG